MEYKCDLCGKICKQVYIKLSDYIKNDRKLLVCAECYLKTESTKASDWEEKKTKYF